MKVIESDWKGAIAVSHDTKEGSFCVTHFLTFLQVGMQNIIRPNERPLKKVRIHHLNSFHIRRSSHQTFMISCLGPFQNNLGSFWNDLNHATLRRSVPRRPHGRPDLAAEGCLPRCVRTDGRVEMRTKPVPTLVEPRTFEHCVLKEEHSNQTSGHGAGIWPDGQSGLPSISLDHVSAT